MSISQLVPQEEREKALLAEMWNHLGPAQTGEVVGEVLCRFNDKLPRSELERTTPCGSPWWPGLLRFDLNRLRKHGEACRPEHGYWEITDKGLQRLGRICY